MARKPADEHIREIVKTGSEFAPVPGQVRSRVFAAIRQKTAQRAKPRVSRLLRYSPGLAAIAAAVIAIPLVVLLGLVLVPGPVATGFFVASQKGGIIENRGTSIVPGTVVVSGDVIKTRVHEQVSMYRGQTVALHVFTNTRLGIRKAGNAGENALPDAFTLELADGTFYLNRKTTLDELLPAVAIGIGDYIFTLAGTRAIFSIADDRTITIICFEGIIAADKPIRRIDPQGQITTEPLPVIDSGMKVVISPSGLWSFTKKESWSKDEKAIDLELAGEVSATEFFREISWNEAATDVAGELPPYTVSRIGSIAGTATAVDKVNFFAAASDGDRAWAINQESLFMVSAGNLVRGPSLPPGTSLRVPVTIGNKFVCLSTAHSVILVDTSSSSVSSIQLPADGSIDHAYVPCIFDRRLVVPVQNKGYYVADISASGHTLSLLAAEQFPVSPLAFGNTIITGSYYNKSFAGVDASAPAPAAGGLAQEKFRVTLEGSLFANPVSANNGIYIALDSGSSAAILCYTNAGVKTGSWNLPSGMTTDFAVFGKYVAGILADGNLFILDTASSLVKKPARLFTRELTSRQRRSAGVLVRDGLVYAGTDQGLIMVIDLAGGAVVTRIKIGTEGIYVPCFTAGKDYYCIDNSGAVSRIVKNE